MSKLSRIRGCLLAGACGDALGYPVEFLSGGAIAGNLLGAHLGEEAIPARWLKHLEARALIEDMARMLTEADA